MPSFSKKYAIFRQNASLINDIIVIFAHYIFVKIQNIKLIMKYLRLLVLLLLLPTTGLFAQIEEPDFIDPDDELYFDTDTLLFNDSTEMEIESGSDKFDIENSTVLQMLDLVGGINYFRDTYLDIDTIALNVYNYNKYEVPTFTDEVYAERIRTLAKATTMPLVFNQKVKAYINLYADRKRMQSSRMLGLSYVYFPMFEEMLAKYNLPLELKYLAMVESALNPTAGSHAGAKGLWQFMSATAKDYGLKINTLIDERYDPVRETEAACRFLKALYSRYNDWFLVLAAYNSGPGTVNRAIVRSGGAHDYWAISRYLPEETQNYVPAFIAVNYVMTFASAHNIYPLNPGLLMSGTDTVHVHDYVTFDQISQCVGVPKNDIEFFNPQYTKKIIPGTPETHYALRLPIKYNLLFTQLEDSIYSYAKHQEVKKKAYQEEVVRINNSGGGGTTTIKHTVKKGENLGSIAKKYGVTVSNLKKWNKLRSDVVRPGQKLTIHKGSGGSKSVSGSKSASSGGTVKTHTVKRGETLSSIARKYGCTVNDLKKWNNLRSTNVKAGQKLKIKK